MLHDTLGRCLRARRLRTSVCGAGDVRTGAGGAGVASARGRRGGFARGEGGGDEGGEERQPEREPRSCRRRPRLLHGLRRLHRERVACVCVCVCIWFLRFGFRAGAREVRRSRRA